MSNAVTVRASALTKRFGDFVAVRDVSVEVSQGEIFGYLGANGAGKSTTIRILCGLLAASGGSAEVAGIDVIRRPLAVRKVIGYMSQKFSLYLDLTVEENLAFFGGAYGLSGRGYRLRRDHLVRDLGIDQHVKELTASLPPGIRQRLALACALLHEPRVVFLDEPTASVDPQARRAFWRVIRRLAGSGATIFVTTHYLDEAEYCDRVGLMVEGRLAALDTPARLKQAFVPGRMFEVRGAKAREVRRATSSLPVLGVEPFGAALHVRVAEGGPSAHELRELLARAKVDAAAVSPTNVTLEDVFLEVVGRGGTS